MIIRNLDRDGDILFGQGKQNYLVNNEAIALNIKTRLLSFLNNCVWDMTSGIDWFTFLRKPGNQTQITLAVRATILKSFGVVKINNLSVNFNGRKLSLSYNIDTIFTSNFSAQLQNLQEMLLNANF